VTEPLERFAEAYRAGLTRHLSGGGEDGLAIAHDLGRWALDASLGLLEVVELHQRVVRDVEADGAASGLANQFLLQSLAAFDMAQRGFWEAQERVRLEEELVSRFRAVTEGSIAIIGHRASEDRLAEFLQQARNVVDARDAAIWIDDQGQPLTTGTAELTGRLSQLVADATRTWQPVRVQTTGSDDGEPALAVPLVISPGGVRGAVVVWGGREFDAADQAALGQLASIGSIAWDNARLFEREHQISITLQHSLLPEALPSVPGMALAARYVPAGPGVEIGGDWYDVIELDGGHLGFVVGDVGGHGLKAASVMGQLRLALRAYAIDGYSPAEVVARVDRLLQRLDPTQIATMIYAGLDVAANKLGIVNAGHPQPLLIDPSGHPQFIAAGRSMAIGVDLGDVSHHEEGVETPRGSSVLLYTDGLIESRRRGIDEGMAALASTTRGFAGSPEELCDMVLSEMAGPPLEDDVCLLAIRID
jgi:serine phosphatase RsbU (regulator of sigma subunit)